MDGERRSGDERRSSDERAVVALAEDPVPSHRLGRYPPERLRGGVARLPGQVVTCRAHLEHPFVADLHGAGLRHWFRLMSCANE
jgi:hypothetical protein